MHMPTQHRSTFGQEWEQEREREKKSIWGVEEKSINSHFVDYCFESEMGGKLNKMLFLWR